MTDDVETMKEIPPPLVSINLLFFFETEWKNDLEILSTKKNKEELKEDTDCTAQIIPR